MTKHCPYLIDNIVQISPLNMLIELGPRLSQTCLWLKHKDSESQLYTISS